MSIIRAGRGRPPSHRSAWPAKLTWARGRAGASTDGFDEGDSCIRDTVHGAEPNGEQGRRGHPMNRTLLGEGVVLFLISLGGIVGGLSQYLNRDARTQSSVLAPGTYVLALSVALALTAVVYVSLSARRASQAATVVAPQRQAPWISAIVIKMVGAFAVYAYLIEVVGYLVPTLLFLLVEFRLLGVKSWKTNIALTAIVTGVFYIVFIKYCEMILPQGFLFE